MDLQRYCHKLCDSGWTTCNLYYKFCNLQATGYRIDGTEHTLLKLPHYNIKQSFSEEGNWRTKKGLAKSTNPCTDIDFPNETLSPTNFKRLV